MSDPNSDLIEYGLPAKTHPNGSYESSGRLRPKPRRNQKTSFLALRQKFQKSTTSSTGIPSESLSRRLSQQAVLSKSLVSARSISAIYNHEHKAYSTTGEINPSRRHTSLISTKKKLACHYCHQEIFLTNPFVYDNKYFHSNCIFCCVCKNSIEKSQVIVKHSRLFCKNCWPTLSHSQSFTTTSNRDQKPYLSRLEKSYSSSALERTVSLADQSLCLVNPKSSAGASNFIFSSFGKSTVSPHDSTCSQYFSSIPSINTEALDSVGLEPIPLRSHNISPSSSWPDPEPHYLPLPIKHKIQSTAKIRGSHHPKFVPTDQVASPKKKSALLPPPQKSPGTPVRYFGSYLSKRHIEVPSRIFPPTPISPSPVPSSYRVSVPSLPLKSIDPKLQKNHFSKYMDIANHHAYSPESPEEPFSQTSLNSARSVSSVASIVSFHTRVNRPAPSEPLSLQHQEANQDFHELVTQKLRAMSASFSSFPGQSSDPKGVSAFVNKEYVSTFVSKAMVNLETEKGGFNSAADTLNSLNLNNLVSQYFPPDSSYPRYHQSKIREPTRSDPDNQITPLFLRSPVRHHPPAHPSTKTHFGTHQVSISEATASVSASSFEHLSATNWRSQYKNEPRILMKNYPIRLENTSRENNEEDSFYSFTDNEDFLRQESKKSIFRRTFDRLSKKSDRASASSHYIFPQDSVFSSSDDSYSSLPSNSSSSIQSDSLSVQDGLILFYDSNPSTPRPSINKESDYTRDGSGLNSAKIIHQALEKLSHQRQDSNFYEYSPVQENFIRNVPENLPEASGMQKMSTHNPRSESSPGFHDSGEEKDHDHRNSFDQLLNRSIQLRDEHFDLKWKEPQHVVNLPTNGTYTERYEALSSNLARILRSQNKGKDGGISLSVLLIQGTSLSSRAIRFFTHSRFSHVGLIFSDFFPLKSDSYCILQSVGRSYPARPIEKDVSEPLSDVPSGVGVHDLAGYLLYYFEHYPESRFCIRNVLPALPSRAKSQFFQFANDIYHQRKRIPYTNISVTNLPTIFRDISLGTLSRFPWFAKIVKIPISQMFCSFQVAWCLQNMNLLPRAPNAITYVPAHFDESLVTENARELLSYGIEIKLVNS